MMSAHNYQVVSIIQIILSRIYNNNPSNRLGEYEFFSFLTDNDVKVNFGLFLSFHILLPPVSKFCYLHQKQFFQTYLQAYLSGIRSLLIFRLS